MNLPGPSQIPVPQSPAPQTQARAQSPRRKSRRLRIAAASALALAIAGITAHFAFNKGTTSTAESTAAASRLEARKVLSSFLTATSAESRAGHVITGDKLLPLMQAWYTSHESETLSSDAFEEPGWTFSSPSADLVALECPRDRGRSPVVACFKKSDTGAWQLDWEIWAQTLDGQFRNFINRPAEGEHTLRARLARNCSDSDSTSGPGITVSVTDPFDATQTMEFDITRPDLLALYQRDLPKTGTRTATVQLVWLNDSLTGTLTPSLRRHVCWGFPGLDAREPEAVCINMVSKNRPPPGIAPVPPSVLAAGPKIDAVVKTALSPATTGSLKGSPAPTAGDIKTAQK